MVSTLLMKYDALIVANRQTPQPVGSFSLMHCSEYYVCQLGLLS